MSVWNKIMLWTATKENMLGRKKYESLKHIKNTLCDKNSIYRPTLDPKFPWQKGCFVLHDNIIKVNSILDRRTNSMVM